jgi:hypothetical protein
MTNNEDFSEDSTMQELHQIRKELDRQQIESGLSILEWLEVTEKDFRKSLTEDGFRMVKRGDRIFMYEIKPHSKTQKKSSASEIISQKSKTPKHKSYNDYIEDSTMQEMHLIREDRTFSDKTEKQPKRKHVKYKTATKRRRTTSRK